MKYNFLILIAKSKGLPFLWPCPYWRLCGDTLKDSQSSEIISKLAISFFPSLEKKKLSLMKFPVPEPNDVCLQIATSHHAGGSDVCMCTWHSLGSGLKHTPLDSGEGFGYLYFFKSLEDCNVFQDEEPVFCLLGSPMTSFLLGKVGKEVWGWHTRWDLQGWASGRWLSPCRGCQNQGRGQNSSSSPSWKEVA